jgi:hypothetical protein
MNEEIKKYIEKYCSDNGFDCDDDNDIWETLLDSGSMVFQKETRSARWWNECFYVVDLAGRLIGFDWAETTGDESAKDKGFEPDVKSICNVEKTEKQVTVITYDRV